MRVIEKVEYAREYGIRSHGELSDWCLIQLDPGRYEKALSRLENRVFIGTGFHLVNEAFREAGPDEDVTFKLQGVNSTSFATDTCRGFTYKLWHVMVGKRGSGSGLTFGSYNQVKSVVRHIYNADCPPFTAVEWCIIADPDKPDAAFSKGGDSGACVWTLDGSIMGMITSGLTRERVLEDGTFDLDRAVDVTYTTPMQWILEDVRACGLHLEVV